MGLANNSFHGGMVLDINELDTPSNTYCTNALNATVATFNGNEGAIQNEMGNCRIINNGITAQLPENSIILGSVEYGGVIYYVLQLEDGRNEIGSFPSPDYESYENNQEEYNKNLIWNYAPLHVLNDNEPLIHQMGFDTNNAVNMLAEPSFDGSVNLILNDGEHSPRLINTGFHVQNNNTYEIIERYNSNNTNRYSEDSFDLQTSLYRGSDKLSKFKYEGTVDGGDLKVGNYVFYAVSCDKDGNESDIICESGVVSIFIGEDGNPFQVNGGLENQNSYKSAKLKVLNIDSAYSYLRLFYTRTTSLNNQLAETLAYKVDKMYEVKDGICDITFSGTEVQEPISINDLNIQYFNANNAKAQALNQNMLFLANVTQDNGENNQEHIKLRKLSLKIIPTFDSTEKINLKSDYTYDYTYSEGGKNSYYNSKYIYKFTGYHANEFYRFGIVYIRKDNSLTPVYNVLGYVNEKNPPYPSNPPDSFFDSTCKIYGNYNNSGVIKSGNITDITQVLGIQFKFDQLDNNDKNFLNLYKGFFFVRQKRIPTLLAQGYVTNVCEEAFIPSINLGINYTDKNISEPVNISYTYESFVHGGKYLQQTHYENLYPKNVASNKGGYLLSHSYTNRLFSLTDNSWAYLNTVENRGPVGSFFTEYLGGNIQDEWFFKDEHRTIQYGGEDENNYLMLCVFGNSCNADFHFFTKVQPVQINSIIKDGNQFKVIVNNETYDVVTELYNTYPVNVDGYLNRILFYKDNVLCIGLFEDEYTLTTNYSGIESQDSENIDVAYQNNKIFYNNDNSIKYVTTFEEIACNDNTKNRFKNRKIRKLISEDGYTRVSSAYAENNNSPSVRYIGDWHVEMDGSVRKIYDNDDLVMRAALYSSETLSTDIIEVYRSPEKRPITQERVIVICPKWIRVGSQYYTYVGQLVANGGSCEGGRIVNSTMNQIQKWYRKENAATESTEASKKSYDSEITSVNGKYYGETGYTTETDKAAAKFNPMEKNSFAIFCPEFELNAPYYNNFFTGSKFKIKGVTEPKPLTISDKRRLYTYDNTESSNNNTYSDVNLISVKENVSLVALQHELDDSPKEDYHMDHGLMVYFSTKAGDATKVSFKYAGAKFLAYVYPNTNSPTSADGDNSREDSGMGIDKGKYKLLEKRPFNLVRGIYGPYVGAYCSSEDLSNRIVNIYIPEYNDSNSAYVEVRGLDSSPYQAISDRHPISDLESNPIEYRGDCFIGYFTHRINRNFQDPTAPYNDTIINSDSFRAGFNECFQDEFRMLDLSKDGAKKFNLGDVNAIRLGSWVTFPVRASMNISLRAVDRSYVDERLLCGNDRAFYPVHGLDASGSYKIPESDAYNLGFSKSGSEKLYYNLNQSVFNKVYYKNRIVYSNVLQSSALTNGNRIFLSEHYKDYTDLFGEIIKLISISSNLLAVCEHGILLIPVNERALAAEGQGGMVFINTSNVLPDNPVIISDTYGSKWEESVVSTPYGVFGIDESSKKIWYTDGNKLTLISDFKVQEFLNNWLKVSGNKEIGKCNIKSHYIKYKNDVIFTLYDTNADNLWNLCYNINDLNFKTFYSWLPIDSQNIGNNLISVNVLNKSNILYKHGHSYRVPSEEELKPTMFYDELHPFEFEFVVRDEPGVHKIFDNLEIISNKAKPESFHYEIVGECYNFGNLKKIAYIRLEELKELYKTVIDNIKYDEDVVNIDSEYDNSNYGRAIIFPQYYSRLDKPIQIYDNYKQMNAPSYDYDALSGTEIIRYKKLNEYRLWNHTKAVDVRDKGGLIRGNMHYREDKWYVQINPINYVETNEKLDTWTNSKPPVILANIQLSPEYAGSLLYVPEGFNNKIYTTLNIAKRKEVAIKDKYIKIRIRYKGDNLAIISAINTIYRTSYS